MTEASDTICALATAPGVGGIAVVRVSGPRAFVLVDAVSRRPKNGSCATQQGHTLRRAHIVNGNGERVDDVLLAVFHAPHSLTGEDVVEVQAHGGPVPVRRILAALYAAGARPAAPGEFTLRAFLHGKMDLAQAEAVADQIAAQTDEAHTLARRQGEGRLSEAVRAVRETALSVLARIEAVIDFPEDVGGLDTDGCLRDLEASCTAIDRLLATANRGILTRAGLSLVLAGRPNVGKSSLLNALLGISRAIVTDIPGTTRDTVEETAMIGGIPVRAVDTAGLRETSDLVERLGVERTWAALSKADIIVYVMDALAGDNAEDRALRASLPYGVPYLVVWNKWDLVAADRSAGLPPDAISLSAATGWNLPALEDAIVQAVGAGEAVPSGEAVVTHARHRHALEAARAGLEAAHQTLLSSLPIDFASGDVRAAIDALGEITGETASPDIIGEIFSRFCIGK